MKQKIVILKGKIEQLLQEYVSNGTETGCQAAVFLDGELVVDAFAGVTRQGGSEPVDSNTLFPIFSAGKAIITTAFLRLHERGLVGLDQKVGEIWPEYACNGKEETTVRHILQHRSGVSIRTPYDYIEQIADWDVMTARVAAVKPVFEPGSATRYQTINYSWLLGELIQRITGLPLAQVLHDEVYQPGGLQNMFFGVPDDKLSRVAVLTRGKNMPPVPDPAPCWDYSLEEIMNNRVIQQACLPGFNGITTAVDLARHYAILLDTESPDRLLSADTLREATTMTLAPNDEKPPSRAEWGTFGLGYQATHPDENDVGTNFGHSGYGGNMGKALRKKGLTYACTHNLINSSPLSTVLFEMLNEI